MYIISHAIFRALNEMSFHSIRILSSTLKIPKSTINNCIHSMGFIVKHLKFVPHTINSSQKVQKANFSKQLLDVSKQERHQSWAFFLTGDKSWFYFINDHETQWLLPNQKPSTKPKKIILTPNPILTIFLFPSGFIIVEMIPQGQYHSA